MKKHFENYIIVEEKKMVICIVDDKYGNKFRGIAKCHDSDRFDVEKGKRIAFLKATNKRKTHYVKNSLQDKVNNIDSLIKNLTCEKQKLEKHILFQHKVIATNCEEINNI